MPKKQKNKNNSDVTINLKGSSLAEFTKRPLPNEKEVDEFDKIIDEEAGTFQSLGEDADGKIEESLSEIYQDENGAMVDVKKMDVKKRHGFIFWFFSFLLTIFLIGGGAYYGYNNLYLQSGTDAVAVDFFIEGETEVVAGEEYFYTLRYKNNSNIAIKNIHIQANYPEHFKVLDIYPENKDENNAVWKIEILPPHSAGNIKIKGMMLAAKDETGVMFAEMSYSPENFSSEFKEEASINTVINDIGIDFDFDHASSVLVGETEELTLHFNAKENNFINNFRLTLEPKENVEILNYIGEGRERLAVFEQERPGVWQISEVGQDEVMLPIRIKFLEKETEEEKLCFSFEYRGNDESYTKFKDEILNFEVMKSDLNLTLIINGSREDKGVNFGGTLNYSVVYKNKGETKMKNVVIMAVLESDFLDWTTMQFDAKGKERGNTITWTKEEIPSLASIEKNQEGVIDFSVDVMKAAPTDGSQEYQIKSYAQFSIGQFGEEEENEEKLVGIEDNLSNTIINVINSDLELSEAIKYFNEDNIPVGTGPHPPKAGEITSYKVYWSLSNNLHELKDLAIKVKLPEYVAWDNKNRATVGEIKYDETLREVRWEIGRLPVTVFQASGEFSISVTPAEEDKNKIMVLLPGSEVTAVDDKTKAELSETTKAKTTKLEDDKIAQGDGIVE
ncbi:hypothetical protein KAU09_00565 [Candidatus Parcubacteria bacterium]|nr:hypothetical protein [Candidatus Parcubacteria bacterium]